MPNKNDRPHLPWHCTTDRTDPAILASNDVSQFDAPIDAPKYAPSKKPIDDLPPDLLDDRTALCSEARDAYLKLALVPGVGPKTLSALIEFFGNPVEACKANLSRLGKVHGVGPKIATSIRDAMQSGNANRIIEKCEQENIRTLIPGDSEFPRLLHEIPNPPCLLFIKGKLIREDALSIGMVGTRHCTTYGTTMADRISRSLARKGLTIVSGLARGIDAIAHRSALAVKGRTIAVLGSSLTEIYPPEHHELSQQILENGALLSETPSFSQPKAGVFPQRNRIISGLSLGVVVVEAAERSGSLITARHAGEQGRDVFAIPGAVTSRMSRGCNQLIRDGAILVQDADEILEHLGPLVESVVFEDGTQISHPAELQLNDIETSVMRYIEETPIDIDQLVQVSGLPVSRVLSTLSVLQLKGLVKRPSTRSVSR